VGGLEGREQERSGGKVRPAAMIDASQMESAAIPAVDPCAPPLNFIYESQGRRDARIYLATLGVHFRRQHHSDSRFFG